MKDKELWLLNTTKSDVMIGDLGIKILANKSVDIYKYNPNLTEDKVKVSMESGSIKKRVDGKILKVIKNIKKKSTPLSKIKESKVPLKARKTKSSVVLEQTIEEVEVGKEFDFADYGLGELSKEAGKNQASVIVKVKQDVLEDESADTTLVPKVDGTLSRQSAVVMEAQQKVMINPVGKMAQVSSNKNQSFVVTKLPASEIIVEPKLVNEKPKIQKVNNAMVVGEIDKPRSLVDVAKVQKSDMADAKIQMQPPQIDTQVATKIESGAIVMGLKEVPIKKEKPKKKVKPQVK